jgi:DNA-binding transcriptional regulator GbsR (MarR family)
VSTPEESALGSLPDRAELLRFVERFAMALADFGMQRMPARVFAYVLADDAERYTAAELASALRVSPAAISGAVRYLVQVRLLGKEREPGERVDTYRVYDANLWYTIVMQRDQLLDQFLRLAAEGAELLGPDTPGGRRMRETYEFYQFMHRKLATLMDEWQDYKRTVLS